MVYHGADEKRTTFDTRYGSYFAADQARAKGYAEARTGWTGEGELTAAFLNIRNPLVFDADNDADFVAFTDQRDASQVIAANGYDGQILEFPGSIADNDYRVNSPNQVKSVDNTGAFSAENDDIRFSRRSDLNNYPDEREGSGIEDAPEALFADVDDAIRKGGGWNEAKGELEKQTLGRLAHVMHESTLAGVDGAEDYVPSIDKKDAIKQIGILKRRMLSVLGDDKWPMLTEIQTL